MTSKDGVSKDGTSKDGAAKYPSRLSQGGCDPPPLRNAGISGHHHERGPAMRDEQQEKLSYKTL